MTIAKKGKINGLSYDLDNPYDKSKDIHIEFDPEGKPSLCIGSFPPKMNITNIRDVAAILLEMDYFMSDIKNKQIIKDTTLTPCRKCGIAPNWYISKSSIYSHFELRHDFYKLDCPKCNCNSSDIFHGDLKGAIIGWDYRNPRA